MREIVSKSRIILSAHITATLAVIAINIPFIRIFTPYDLDFNDRIITYFLLFKGFLCKQSHQLAP